MTRVKLKISYFLRCNAESVPANNPHKRHDQDFIHNFQSYQNNSNGNTRKRKTEAKKNL